MGMPWVKLYTEFLDDAKVGRLAPLAQLLFLKLMMLAGDCDAEGYLVNGDEPLTDADLAWRLRLPTDDLSSMLNELVHAELVNIDPSSGAYCVIHFQERQGRSQSEKREQWRERKRQQRDNTHAPEQVTEDKTNVTRDILIVTEESRGSHADVTLLEREKIREENTDAQERGLDPPPPKETQSEPSTPPKKLKRTRKPPTPTPEAVKVFHENAHRYPAKSWYDQIADIVGENCLDLVRWGETVHAWVGMGWNPTNAKGMLECYQKGEVPGQNRRSDGRGDKVIEEMDAPIGPIIYPEVDGAPTVPV